MNRALQRISKAVGRPKQIAHAPRDGGRGIDPVHIPRRQRQHPVHQQGIVRTGQHDGVGLRIAINETWSDLGGDGVVADTLAAQGSFREACEIFRADQRDVAVVREIGR